MNIINQLTLRHLLKNKRRTIVTIIGVIISVAMITAVATLGTSFLNLAQNEHIVNEGEWHALYKNVNEKQLKEIKADQQTEKVVLSRDDGYSDLQESENPSMPYLYFKRYNTEGFEQFPIEIIEGRVPEKEDELLISEHIITNGQVDLEIGEKITAEIGNRVAANEDLAELSLGQTFALQQEDDQVAETIEQREAREFTIVGMMKRPTWEPYMAPGYTVLSYLDEDADSVHASVVWNKVNQKSLDHAEELGEKLNVSEVSFNNSLLRYYGLIDDDFLRTSLYSVMAIVMVVIMIGSVSLIYNAFAISVSERSRHLGMLSSVGATKKQKRNSVFFEGFIIGLISIPLGILSGIGGIAGTFYFINPLIQRLGDFTEELTVIVTPMSIVIAIAVSALTIFISTYIPSRRASKVSAIDAIRQSEDIKLSHKKVKTSKVVRKLFGIEADFALKNLKRNKRRYYATVFSLVISIILFLTVSFFGDQLRVSSDAASSGLNYDLKVNQVMNAGDFSDSLIDSIMAMEEVTGLSEITAADADTTLRKNQIHESLKESAIDGVYQAPVQLRILDKASLRSYAEKVDVQYETLTDQENLAGIVINTAKAPGEKRGEITPFQMQSGDRLPLQISEWDWNRESDRDLGDIEVAALTKQRPLGVSLPYLGTVSVIISQDVFDMINQDNHIRDQSELALTSTDPLATTDELESFLDSRMHINTPLQQRQEEEGIILLMSVFTYGFITLITLISIANIFNTISTSIALRKREFGMLKSVGMTPKGFNRMIHYESLFYGIQSLLFGLPISLGIMYLIYRSLSRTFAYPFEFPWGSVIAVIIGVFIVVGSAMLYSSAKVKKENIIDALTQENI